MNVSSLMRRTKFQVLGDFGQNVARPFATFTMGTNALGQRALAQFESVRIRQQRVVEKPNGVCPSEYLRQENLPTGGREEIFATDDEIAPVPKIVDDDGKLIRPLPVAISQEKVSALLGRGLQLRTQQQVVERNGRRKTCSLTGGGEIQTNSVCGSCLRKIRKRQAAGTTASAVVQFRSLDSGTPNVAPRAVARIDETATRERTQGVDVGSRVFRLFPELSYSIGRNTGKIVDKTEPREILPDRRFEFWT